MWWGGGGAGEKAHNVRTGGGRREGAQYEKGRGVIREIYYRRLS